MEFIKESFDSENWLRIVRAMRIAMTMLDSHVTPVKYRDILADVPHCPDQVRYGWRILNVALSELRKRGLICKAGRSQWALTKNGKFKAYEWHSK